MGMVFHAMGHWSRRTTEESPKNKEYLIIATYYFSKWMEAEPLYIIIGAVVNSFVWKNIIGHFGIPSTILTNNGLQFTSFKVTDWYKEFGFPLPSYLHHALHARQWVSGSLLKNKNKK